MPKPIVLVLGGLDPTGGAGLAADLEALLMLGARGAPVATALTVQDTRGVSRVVPVEASLILAQAEAVLADLPIVAVKIGLLPDRASVHAVGRLAMQHSHLVLILDPVLASGRGDPLSVEPIEAALCSVLLPHVDLLTPNLAEARRLTGLESADSCGEALLALGARAVLLTGGDQPTAAVEHVLYQTARIPRRGEWPRLPGQYHGSGCTLAAACAAGLARGLEMDRAVAEAEQFAWDALRAADCRGRGQCLPDRGPRP